LLPYNNPKILIFSGVVGAAIAGSAMPGCGIVMSYILSVLTMPIQYLSNDDGTLTGYDYLESRIKLYASLMALTGLVAFISGMF
jgi:hypothetical protein